MQFHEMVTIGQSVSGRTGRRVVYTLLNSIDVVVFRPVPMQVHFMPKLSQYVSYAALAAALIFGFAVTAHAGAFF